ncbi:MAG: hypothetical protein IPI97_14390 [Nitrosomonas sp.]|nr:hypothetical protein [Nitrosomonas sp.]
MILSWARHQIDCLIAAIRERLLSTQSRTSTSGGKGRSLTGSGSRLSDFAQSEYSTRSRETPGSWLDHNGSGHLVAEHRWAGKPPCRRSSANVFSAEVDLLPCTMLIHRSATGNTTLMQAGRQATTEVAPTIWTAR